MKYFLFASLFILILSCNSPYKHLQRSEGDFNALLKFKPIFTTSLYRAEVDVVGKHLSGLLLIKCMPDSSLRLDFSNETGVKYFDFEFAKDGRFTVHYILEKMNRKAVVSTLRNDFEMILIQIPNNKNSVILKDDQFIYYVLQDKKKYRYYITDKETNHLIRIEGGSKRKPVVQAFLLNYTNGIPDSISIDHLNFNFTISLKLLER